MSIATPASIEKAERLIARCRELALCTETPGQTTRMFLCDAMQQCHERVSAWMAAAGMEVSVDHAGNLHGVWAGTTPDAPRFLIASHLDTVPNAGAFDGILGVLMGVAVVEELAGKRLPFAIEVIGFSEEEGTRFGAPFLGSRALLGVLSAELLARTDAEGLSVADAIKSFGLDVDKLHEAKLTAMPMGYLEIHIEQGPVLESEELSLGVVDAIAGQSRMEFVFTGEANHAGTTPMHLRKDALMAAAEWMLAMEEYARNVDGLVATTGRITATPGAVNVIAAEARLTLDVRHAKDKVRETAVGKAIALAGGVAMSRNVRVASKTMSEQNAVPMDAHLTETLAAAVKAAGLSVRMMVSGAGHDAMMIAPHIPSTMLFLRSPGGLSHHPDESVVPEDVEHALAAAVQFVKLLAKS